MRTMADHLVGSLAEPFDAEGSPKGKENRM
jgi:hypothetical protein